MPKTVAVFFGGKSNEREISVITGMLAVNLLRNTSYRVVPVILSPVCGMMTGNVRGVEDFRKGAKTKFRPVRLEGRTLRTARGRKLADIDVALNCCHGGMGEDGTLSALLRFHGIPSASPEAPMSAVFMDKTLTKIAAKGLGIPVLEGRKVAEGEPFEAALSLAEELGFPVVVKPAHLGSSIGIKVAKDPSELESALGLAFRLDDSALLEAYLPARRDINCAVCRRKGEIVLSPPEEVFSDEEILTFSEKYEMGARTNQLPADLPQALTEEIGGYTRTLYRAFGGKGVVRADFFVAEGRVYFNELNTVPGSLSCYLFGKSLSENRAFLCDLIEEAAPAASKETLSTGILETDVFSGRKR